MGDWIQVFAKALEFYKGKIKGFLHFMIMKLGVMAGRDGAIA